MIKIRAGLFALIFFQTKKPRITIDSRLGELSIQDQADLFLRQSERRRSNGRTGPGRVDLLSQEY